MNDSRAMLRGLRLITPTLRAITGEGPIWDECTETLHWVDIDRGELHQCRADRSGLESTKIGQRVCCVALRRKEPGFIAGLERSVALITLHPLTICALLDTPASVDVAGRQPPFELSLQ